MLLKPPKYRPSQFRGGGEKRTCTGQYMMDDSEQMRRDPRARRISAIEQAVVKQCIAELPAGSLVLDVPCGNGRMGRWVAQRSDLRLVSLDYNFDMLKAMGRRDESTLLATRARGDVLALPLAEKSVDLVINCRLMHHIADDETAANMYRQIARVARGVVVTSFWSTHCWRYLRRRLLGKTVRGFPRSPAAFAEICRGAGLEVRRMVPVRKCVEEQVMVICQSR